MALTFDQIKESIMNACDNSTIDYAYDCDTEDRIVSIRDLYNEFKSNLEPNDLNVIIDIFKSKLSTYIDPKDLKQGIYYFKFSNAVRQLKNIINTDLQSNSNHKVSMNAVKYLSILNDYINGRNETNTRPLNTKNVKDLIIIFSINDDNQLNQVAAMKGADFIYGDFFNAI